MWAGRGNGRARRAGPACPRFQNRQAVESPEDSNYDPCADLSAVLVTVQDATNSSPDQALMFHRGTFVGTATPRAYPFTKFDRSGIHKRHRGAELSDTSKL